MEAPFLLMRYITILLFSALNYFLTAQNLILNPSFEDVTSCPATVANGGNITVAPPWSTPTGSTDIWSTCDIGSFGLPRLNTTYPYTRLPLNGDNLVGFFPLNPSTPGEWREYLQGKLSEPLAKDSTYQFEFHFAYPRNRAQYFYQEYHYKFTPDSLTTGQPLNTQSRFYAFENFERIPLTEKQYSDTLGWVKICSNFKAEGGEQFFTMGIFDSMAQARYTLGLPPNTLPSIYMFFDGFSLTKIPQHIADPIAEDNLIFCEDTPIRLGINATPYDSVVWNGNVISDSLTIQSSDTVLLEAFINQCAVYDTLISFLLTDTTALLPRDTSLCHDEFPFELNSPVPMVGHGNSILINEPSEITISVARVCGPYWQTVEINTIPELKIKNPTDTVICANEFPVVLFSPSGANRTTWNDGSVLDSLIVFEPGRYSFEAANRCSDISSDITIREQPILNLNLLDTIFACLQAPLIIAANPGFESYFWSNGSASATIQIMEEGLYFVEGEYLCGTEIDTSWVIQRGGTSVIRLRDTLYLNLGEETSLNPSVIGPTLYDWNWDSNDNELSCQSCQNPILTAVNQELIRLSAMDEYGCNYDAELFLHVNKDYHVFFPNAFSPNGDGVNDTWGPYFANDVKTITSVKIFDRWGGIRFEEETPIFSNWDGRSGGQNCSTGVYVFIADVEFIDGTTKIFSGEIHLIR